jgi:Spy/CpxP family protein refolding chaperone
MKKYLSIILVIGLVFGLSSSIKAQRDFGRSGGQHMRGFHDPDKMEQRMKNLENLRLLKLLETLELNEEQNDKFIAAFSQFRKTFREIHEELEREVTALADYLETENKNNEIIMEHIDRVEEIRLKREMSRKDFFEKIKSILTPEQLGRMVVFDERFERKMLQTIRGFRAPAPGPDEIVPGEEG